MTLHRTSPAFARLARTVALVFAMGGLALAGCGSADQRSLVLVNVSLGAYATSDGTVDVKVVLTNGPSGIATFGANDNPGGHFGVYLPDGSAGDGTASVEVRNADGCLLAGGSGSVTGVSPGKIAGPFPVNLTASPTPCVSDGGTDVPVPPPAEVGASPEAGGPDSAAGVESGTVPPADGALPDELPAEVAPDAPVSPDAPVILDVAGEGTAVDVSLPIDATKSEAGGEVAPPDSGPNTLSVLRNCTTYIHTLKDSLGQPYNWGIRQLVFTPDGKNLLSFGDDGRVKLWDVTATGLAEPQSGLVFTGSGTLYGAVSPDGTYLAVGDGYSVVTIYDLPSSIQLAGAVSKWTLQPDQIAGTTSGAELMQFSTDLSHIVVGYYGGGEPDPNHVAVWELGTSPKVINHLALTWPERAWVALPGSYPGPLWVASIARLTGDAGYETTVALTDVSQPTTSSKVSAVAQGYVDDVAFAPDGNSLATGLDTGEVSIWDITGKTKLTQQKPPAIAAAPSQDKDVLGLAFSPDGRYIAANWSDYFTLSASSVKLLSLAQKTSVSKTMIYSPWTLAFAPNGLGLAVGEDTDGTIVYCTP